MAIGPVATAFGVNSTTIGAASSAMSLDTTAVGAGAGAIAQGSTVIGANATSNAYATNSVAIGSYAKSEGVNTLAIGSTSNVLGENSAGIGTSVFVTAAATNAMALGASSTASAVGAVALGANSIADRADTISVGTSAAQRQLVNLAAGTTDTDAVNVGQLRGMTAALGGGAGVNADGTIQAPTYTLDGNTYNDVGAALVAVDSKAASGAVDGVRYDTSLHDKVTFGGVGAAIPVTLTNIAAGKTDTDAVNVTQLKGVTTALGAGADVNSDGTIKAPSYKIGGRTYNDLGSAFDAASAGASPDAVLYDTSAHDRLTLGGGAPGEVVLTNVADATADTDAVNLRQLKAAGLTVDPGTGASTNAFVAYDDLSKGAVTFNAGGKPTQLKNVAAGTDAFDAVNFGQMESYVANYAGGSGGGNGAAGPNAVQYDDASQNTVTLGGAGHDPVKLGNVAAGTDANDAVNYSQFASLQSAVDNIAGGTGNTYISIGSSSDPSGGTPASASGTDSIAIGNGASAPGAAAIAIGAGTTTSGDHSVALGAGSSAPASNSVALGANSVADRDNSVSVGAPGAERQITNVAAGTAPTDAVNVGQMSSAISGVYQSMHDMDRDFRRGIASSAALNIVTPYLPGRTTLNAGVAGYRGQAAIGIGVSRWNEKGTVNYNLGVSSAGGNSTIVRAGLGIVLGN
jgi:autotransporter adhesin